VLAGRIVFSDATGYYELLAKRVAGSISENTLLQGNC
jgi:hypothetical protein